VYARDAREEKTVLTTGIMSNPCNLRYQVQYIEGVPSQKG